MYNVLSLQNAKYGNIVPPTLKMLTWKQPSILDSLFSMARQNDVPKLLSPLSLSHDDPFRIRDCSCLGFYF